MKVTPFSKAPYYKMMLSNGSDAALVDRHGSMYDRQGADCGDTQGTACGWYKVPHRIIEQGIMPVIQAGCSVFINNICTEAKDYEQQFDPAAAVLTTLVKSFGAEWKITSFMASDFLYVEHVEILKVPEAETIDFSFSVRKPQSCFSFLKFLYDNDIKFNLNKERLNINYYIQEHDISGSGFMFVDTKAHIVNSGEFKFCDIKQGFNATRFLSLVDSRDCDDYDNKVKENIERCKNGYQLIKKTHENEWLKYHQSSSVKIPDEKMQYIYDLSRYSCRGHKHPQTGAINCGMFPYLWKGGVCGPDDSNYSYVGMLRTGNEKDANQHLNFYRDFLERGKAFAKKHNLPGASMPVWANCFGEHAVDGYEFYIFKYKMSLMSSVCEAFYWLWKYYPEHKSNRENLKIYGQILDFVYAAAINDDGKTAHVKTARAGDETHVMVENDTLATVLHAHAFRGFEEMSNALNIPVKSEYKGLGSRLYSALSENIKDDFLYTYKNSFTLAAAFCLYIYDPQQQWMTYRCFENFINSDGVRTPWGLDGNSPHGNFRDWPWFGSRTSMIYAHLGNCEKAFYWLLDSIKYAASNGALPEKICIQDYPVRYWYSATHGLVVWAVTYALCHMKHDGDLRLLYGLDGQWQDFSFSKLRVMSGLDISATVKDGAITYLEVKNHNHRTQEIAVNHNAVYNYSGKKTISLKANETYKFEE